MSYHRAAETLGSEPGPQVSRPWGELGPALWGEGPQPWLSTSAHPCIRLAARPSALRRRGGALDASPWGRTGTAVSRDLPKSSRKTAAAQESYMRRIHLK
jgi:hypothetical protein